MPVLKNARHEAFAQNLAKGTMTADQAYQEAGYKPARANASRLNLQPHIQARVAELMGKSAARVEVTIASVLDEMRKLGFSDLRNAFDENGRLLAPSKWSDDFAAAVSSIEVVTKTLPTKGDEPPEVEYIHKIKVWDKNSALEKLAKAFGMFVERVQHSGKIGVDVANTQLFEKMTSAERASVRSILQAAATRASKAADQPTPKAGVVPVEPDDPA